MPITVANICWLIAQLIVRDKFIVGIVQELHFPSRTF